MIKLNSDKELVKDIRDKLKKNKEVYGESYCPCIHSSLYNTEDNVCMCKSFQDQIANKIPGECHCGLWVYDGKEQFLIYSKA